MKVDKHYFGTLSDGKEVSLFTVSNGRMKLSVTDYGATITSIVLCGKDGIETDVALGYSTLDGYVKDDVFFGAFIGRVANRIGNAAFTLDGKKYTFDVNDGKNTLHGGFDLWHSKMWTAQEVTAGDKTGVEFAHTSPDGEQGMPGTMQVKVAYLLGADNSITCKYTAETDKNCPLNFTNHSYFNLAGRGTILQHTLCIDCDRMLAVGSNLIPTGEMPDVGGTVYDFRQEKAVGRDIAQALDGVGYDNCYVTKAYDECKKRGSALPLEGIDTPLIHAATLREPNSGRSMTVQTNMEGMQLYTGNFIGGKVGKNGTIYAKHSGLCLETQVLPDTPNQPSFPPSILHPGEKLNAITVYTFSF